jgi:sialic acid synthase SpsE
MGFITINGRVIGKPYEPYIIADIGVNHECSLIIAKKMIDEVCEAGAHAAKFQSYKAEKIASKNSPAYWDKKKETTNSQFKLFNKYDAFEPDDYAELAAHCDKKGVDFLSTPFDHNAVDMLDPLVPAFKIASADITNIPLLRKVAKTRKPMIVSTGAASIAEIKIAINAIQALHNNEIALLHCVLNYPTLEENAQLRMIKVLKQQFPNCAIGYSDHVVPDETITALETAMLLGASILEKHFTHDKSLPGNDHYHSMDKKDLTNFKKKMLKYQSLIGKNKVKKLTIEKDARLHARRSIFVSRDVRIGEILTEDMLIAKRPGNGISPLDWDRIIGKIANRFIPKDSLLRWDFFS